MKTVRKYPNSTPFSYAPLIIVVFALIVILSSISSCFVAVPTGHVGVVRRFGAVQDKSLREGLHFKLPYVEEVELVDTRLAAASMSCNAASRDLQTVNTQVTLQFSLDGASAPQIIQRVGNLEKISASLIEPAIQESVKAVTAKFTAEELVTKREAVKLDIQNTLSNFLKVSLSGKDLTEVIRISNVAITEFRFSPEFERAIELKVKAEQEALQARNEKLRRVTQAEAAAAEQELQAKAQAFKIEAESVARAEAIRREAEALKGNPELIQLRSIERWDGTLPRMTTSGGGVIPFLNIGPLDEPRRSGQ